MNSLWDARYVVVDVETSGHDPQRHRIIEIACIVVEYGATTQRFSSLVRCDVAPPPSIVRLTGITPEMLAQAPPEAEVMGRVASLLRVKGSIFVAHNAAFDWRFVRAALERNGYPRLHLPRLCTLRLAQQLGIPAPRGLAHLSDRFGLGLTRHHRAESDAEATAELLKALLRLALQRGIASHHELLRWR
jgi:DNA polymerase-3 subunit epsilon